MRPNVLASALALSLASLSSSGFAQQHEQHTAAGPPQTLADWASGAQLFSGLGSFHRAISTSSPDAQRYFDQGMRYLWAFNHDEATRSFAKAAMLDPNCASCFWGVALTLGPNYNMPVMAEARAKTGWDAVQKARALADRASPVEQALIAAVGTRFAGPAPVDPSNSAPLLKAYVEAMRDVAARFPADADVQTMYAEGLMNTNPWKLWTADGKPGPGTPEILAALQRAMSLDPRHPGANHYWIHAVEASRDPGQALRSAEVLNGMMPAAGHLEHMPAHIFQRVGRYEEAAEANRKGAEADLAYLKRTAAPDYYPMYLVHNYQFLATSAAMDGRRAEMDSALRKARDNMPEAMLLAMPGLDWSVGFLYDGMVRFGQWDALLKEPAPSEKLVGQTISYRQARATALAATGKIDEARAELSRSAALIANVAEDAPQGMNLARPLYAIGQLKAEARVDMASGRAEDAINRLRQAVTLEDRLSYNEPSDMFFPVRHLLGAALLHQAKYAEAEAVYREDLKLHPNTGWALNGLARSLDAQHKAEDARSAWAQFDAAWKAADMPLAGSAF